MVKERKGKIEKITALKFGSQRNSKLRNCYEKVLQTDYARVVIYIFCLQGDGFEIFSVTIPYLRMLQGYNKNNLTHVSTGGLPQSKPQPPPSTNFPIL
jgi:hypothetical protein